MGERLLCKQEVIGSIPFTSTNLLTLNIHCSLIKLTKPSHREFLSRKRFISVHMIIQAMKVHLVDALALRGDEGRDTLR